MKFWLSAILSFAGLSQLAWADLQITRVASKLVFNGVSISSLNCTGVGVSCTVNGGTGTINVAGGSGGGGGALGIYLDGVFQTSISTWEFKTSSADVRISGSSVAFRVDMSSAWNGVVNLNLSTKTLNTAISTTGAEISNYEASNNSSTGSLNTQISTTGAEISRYEASNNSSTGTLNTQISTTGAEITRYENSNNSSTGTLNTAISTTGAEIKNYEASNNSSTGTLNTIISTTGAEITRYESSNNTSTGSLNSQISTTGVALANHITAVINSTTTAFSQIGTVDSAKHITSTGLASNIIGFSSFSVAAMTSTGTLWVLGQSSFTGPSVQISSLAVVGTITSTSAVFIGTPTISGSSLCWNNGVNCFQLPPIDGSNTNVLATDGNKHLSFIAAGAAGDPTSLPLPEGATNYVQMTTPSVQAGAFRVASGTVVNELNFVSTTVWMFSTPNYSSGPAVFVTASTDPSFGQVWYDGNTSSATNLAQYQMFVSTGMNLASDPSIEFGVMIPTSADAGTLMFVVSIATLSSGGTMPVVQSSMTQPIVLSSSFTVTNKAYGARVANRSVLTGWKNVLAQAGGYVVVQVARDTATGTSKCIAASMPFNILLPRQFAKQYQ